MEFTFKKPNGFSLCGSYSVRCMAKPDASVDLLLHLPKVSLCFAHSLCFEVGVVVFNYRRVIAGMFL